MIINMIIIHVENSRAASYFFVETEIHLTSQDTLMNKSWKEQNLKFKPFVTL